MRWNDEDDEDEEEDRPRRSKRAPKSRPYLHEGCGGTVISDDDFTMLADPFQFVSSTYCCACSNFVSLNDVAWEGDRRSIAEWRAAMRRRAPVGLKLFRWVLGPLAAGLVGLLIGLLFERSGAGAGIGFLVGLVAGVFFIVGPLSRAIWRDFYLRCLRE
jgi:hypothetical protein